VSLWVILAAGAGLIFLSAIFSGAETGVYSVSRVRLEAEAQEGRGAARRLSRLFRDDAGLLITLLIGNNLMLELLTRLAESSVGRSGLPDYTHELGAALVLTPLVFLFGELVPKDLFRRRPHLLLALAEPLISVFRWVVSPLAWPLALISGWLERLLGLRKAEFARILRREEMVELLAESRRSGELEPQAEELAQNVLFLRHTPVQRVAIPWDRVLTVDLDKGPKEVRAAVLRSGFTRLPALRSGADRRRTVAGYLHQLDVLGLAPEAGPESELRPLLELPPDLPVDRAVARLQSAGQRIALLGTARAPRGLVTLMDLMLVLASQPRFSQPAAPARIGDSA